MYTFVAIMGDRRARGAMIVLFILSYPVLMAVGGSIWAYHWMAGVLASNQVTGWQVVEALASVAAAVVLARLVRRAMRGARPWKRRAAMAIAMVAPLAAAEQYDNAWYAVGKPVGVDPFAMLWHVTRIPVGWAGERGYDAEDGSDGGYVGDPAYRAYCRARMAPGWTGPEPKDAPGVGRCDSVAPDEVITAFCERTGVSGKAGADRDYCLWRFPHGIGKTQAPVGNATTK